MSAFSNWNGPDCGGGASLPQIKTLEGLLEQLRVITGHVTELRTVLEGHMNAGETATGGVPTNLHAVLQEQLKAVKNELINIMGDTADGTTLGKIIAQLQNDITTAIGNIRDTDSDGRDIKAQDVAAAIALEKRRAVARENEIESDADTRMNELDQKLIENEKIAGAIGTSVATRIAKIRILISRTASNLAKVERDLAETYMNESEAVADLFDDSLFRDVIFIRSALDTVDQAVGKLTITETIDFTTWAEVNPAIRVIHQNDEDAQDENEQRDDLAVLFAVLSDDWNEVTGTPVDGRNAKHPNRQKTFIDKDASGAVPRHHNRHKAGRAYVKFVNTKPWNAIVDATVTVDSESNTFAKYTGSINAQLSKTDDRGRMRFGVFKSTDETGTIHIYLGVCVEDAAQFIQSSDASGYIIRVAGENIHPLTEKYMPPVGSVETVAWVDVYDNAAYAFDKAYVREMFSDNYYDRDGDPVLVTDPDKGTLTLGDEDEPEQLVVNSKERPSIFHGDGQEHKVAYLTDLAQSVYWQREVKLIEKDLATVNSLKVTVSAEDPTVFIPWDPASPNNKPGIYLSEPHAANPSGYLFKADDIALLRQSADVNAEVADGYINATLEDVSADYDRSLITGVDWQHARVTAADGTTTTDALNGTIVVDKTGRFGKITDHIKPNEADPTSVDKVTIRPLPNTTSFAYKLPCYARFDGTTWDYDNSAIDVPGSFDGYVHDITYEWSGFHDATHRVVVDADTQNYYVQSYATWTAHHMNTATMDYSDLDPDPENADTDGWAFTDLKMEGFRAATAQDSIDTHLKDIASIQPDYAEQRRTTVVDLPERPAETIPNPAYIHHKPWTGVSVLDGGSFEQPSDYLGWHVDGGDFTDLAANMPPNMTTVPYNQRFKNVIMRLWRGAYTKQPELNQTPNVALNALATFANTLRWTTGTQPVLVYSDGQDQALPLAQKKWAYHFVPLENYKAGKKILQSFAFDRDPVTNVISTSFEWTDFTIENGAVAGAYTVQYKSSARPVNATAPFKHIANTAFETIRFAEEDPIEPDGLSIVRYESPRLDAIEQELDTEIERAITEEKRIEGKLDDEIERSKTEDIRLDSEIQRVEAERKAEDLDIRADFAEEDTNIREEFADADAAIQAAVDAIESRESTAATPSNKHITKSELDEAIRLQMARALGPVPDTTAVQPFATFADLAAAENVTPKAFYYGATRVDPTANDYVVVLADETRAGATVRYGYSSNNQWVFQYKIENTPFTAEQLAAINSGITATALNALFTAPVYPIGHVLLTMIPGNPAAQGYTGTWQRIAQGRFLIGAGPGEDLSHNGIDIEAGSDSVLDYSTGEYSHQLTIDELPEHNHALRYTGSPRVAPGTEVAVLGETQDGSTPQVTENTGSGISIQLLPPCIGVYIWQKTAM